MTKNIIISLMVVPLFLTSCGESKNLEQTEQIAESTQAPGVSSAASINEFIRMRNEENNKEMERERERAIERGKNRPVDVNSVEYILENEVKDFSMYDIHPLEKYVGKWNYIDAIGNIYPSGSYIDISFDGYNYRYRRQDNSEGRLLFEKPGITILLPDNVGDSIARFILGKPARNDDGCMIFHATQEWPVGDFILDEGEKKFLNAWNIERIGGIWVSDFWFEPNSYFWGEPQYKTRDLSGKNIRFDLEKKTLLTPDERLLFIKDIYKEGDVICLKLNNAEDDEEFFEMRITPLDYAKAYIVHDRHTEWGDSRFSPEEDYVWYLLPREIADYFSGATEIQ